jgi:protein phosphatase
LQAGDIFVLCSDGLSGQVSDNEIGAVASVLPPAEACRFLIDLANMRGGPDNITVVLVRLGGPVVDSNGQAPAPAAHVRPRLPRLPWWPAALLAGTLLALQAMVFEFQEWKGTAALTFVLALAAIVAGVAGLFIHYRRERLRATAEEPDSPAPRIHRQCSCLVEQPLLDRLSRAVRTLRHHAEEKHWAPDWKTYEEHATSAEELLNQGDLPAAFREYCRAMLPLTRVLHKQRNKEEKFQPNFWDRNGRTLSQSD